MSIKQRLNIAEKKAGVGTGVEIHIFSTRHENKASAVESETFLASVGNPKQPGSYFCLSSLDDETPPKFDTRVEIACLEAFGSLPPDWKVGTA